VRQFFAVDLEAELVENSVEEFTLRLVEKSDKYLSCCFCWQKRQKRNKRKGL